MMIEFTKIQQFLYDIELLCIIQVFVMLNPITDKMRKLFSKGRGKRSKLRTEADTPLKNKLFSRSFLPNDKENDPHTINIFSQCSLTPWKSVSLRCDPRSQAKQQEYLKVLKDNERLKQMVKTHQMMEEFYLRELELRRKEKSNLEWRLSVLNEEIQNSSKATKNKSQKQSQILRERVQAARKGLDSTPYSQSDNH